MSFFNVLKDFDEITFQQNCLLQLTLFQVTFNFFSTFVSWNNYRFSFTRYTYIHEIQHLFEHLNCAGCWNRTRDNLESLGVERIVLASVGV